MSVEITKTEQAEYAPSAVKGAAADTHREEPRIYGLFPALVRGMGADGEPFHVRTVLDNFSAGEFSLSLSRGVEVGGQLFVVAEIHAATVALHGTVSRLEPHADGGSRAVVSITHHRFV